MSKMEHNLGCNFSEWPVIAQRRVIAMIEMQVKGLTSDALTKQTIVWLKSVRDDTMLPISIGETEAASILSTLTKNQSGRPLTHDLIVALMDQFGAKVQEVRIVDLKDVIFYAQIVVSSGQERICLDARPSDSIALAIRCGAPIYLSEKVLSKAGLTVKQGKAGLEFQAKSINPDAVQVGTDDLKDAIENLLKETHQTDEKQNTAEGEERLKQLSRKMQNAAKLERYEEAAQIRKEIDRIKGKAD